MKFIKLLGFIVFLLIFSSITYGTSLRVYELTLNYDSDNFELNKLNTKTVDTYKENFGSYNIKIISFDNSTLNISNFGIANEGFFDNFDENGTAISGGSYPLNRTTIELELPYYENAKEIIIYDSKNQEKLKVDVSMFAKNKCGDKNCDVSENNKKCQSDCQSGTKDYYCDGIKENRCDPDCTSKTDSDCKPEDLLAKISTSKELKEKWWIVLFILILIIIYFIIKKNNHQR